MPIEEFDAPAGPADRITMAFFAGLFLGAATALLLAPKPGGEVVGELNKMADGARDKVEDLAEKGREWLTKGEEVIEDFANRGLNVLERGREFLDTKAALVEGLFETGKKSLQRLQEPTS